MMDYGYDGYLLNPTKPPGDLDQQVEFITAAVKNKYLDVLFRNNRGLEHCK